MTVSMVIMNRIILCVNKQLIEKQLTMMLLTKWRNHEVNSTDRWCV